MPERDGWSCTAPGCSSYRNLHRHHIVFRSLGGLDELTHLTTLCASHHQRGIHARVMLCTGQAPNAGVVWHVFAVGVDEDVDVRRDYCRIHLLQERRGIVEVDPRQDDARAEGGKLDRLAPAARASLRQRGDIRIDMSTRLRSVEPQRRAGSSGGRTVRNCASSSKS